jgi:hypothetical protein
MDRSSLANIADAERSAKRLFPATILSNRHFSFIACVSVKYRESGWFSFQVRRHPDRKKSPAARRG